MLSRKLRPLGRERRSFASDTYPPDVNGAARFSERLALGLASNGHNILVLAPGRNFKDEREVIEEKLEIYRLKSIRLKMIHEHSQPKTIKSIEALYKKAIKTHAIPGKRIKN